MAHCVEEECLELLLPAASSPFPLCVRVCVSVWMQWEVRWGHCLVTRPWLLASPTRRFCRCGHFTREPGPLCRWAQSVTAAAEVRSSRMAFSFSLGSCCWVQKQKELQLISVSENQAAWGRSLRSLLCFYHFVSSGFVSPCLKVPHWVDTKQSKSAKSISQHVCNFRP